MGLEFEELTERIIGAAIEVHRTLGPGFLESIYERALVIEFCKRGLAFERQLEVSIKYDGQEVGKHRLDLLVEGNIVIELKTVKNIEDIHYAITKSYLKAINKHHALLFNFAKLTLEIKRVAFS